MITGAHVVLYSTDAEADRVFFRDVLEYPYVDAGHDWLIFALPPAELAVHPAGANGPHELFLMCDDLDDFVASMAGHGVRCSPPRTERWGTIVELRLPGGGTLGVYTPSHPIPPPAGGTPATRRA